MTKTQSYEKLYLAVSQAWSAVMATTEFQLIRENSAARYEATKTLNALEEKRIAIVALLESTPERKHYDLVNKKLNDNPNYIAYLQSVMEGQDD